MLCVLLGLRFGIQFRPVTERKELALDSRNPCAKYQGSIPSDTAWVAGLQPFKFDDATRWGLKFAPGQQFWKLVESNLKRPALDLGPALGARPC